MKMLDLNLNPTPDEQIAHYRERCGLLWNALYEANDLLSEYVERQHGPSCGNAFSRKKIDMFDEILFFELKNMPEDQRQKREDARQAADEYKKNRGWLTRDEMRALGAEMRSDD